MRSRARSPEKTSRRTRPACLAKRALVSVSVLTALGCARRGQSPSTTSSASASPIPVAIRFSRPGARLDILRSRRGAVIAHCDADCDLVLPPARYELRVSGEGPDARERLDVRGASSIRIRVGNSAAFSVGAGTQLVGGLAAVALPLALWHALSCSEGEPPSSNDSHSCSRTTSTLLIVGVSGVALAIAGAAVAHANTTRIEVEQPTASPTPLFGDARGVGLRF